MGLYIGLTYEVRGDCLWTLTKMETKVICLCKQAMNVEDSSKTIVKTTVNIFNLGLSRFYKVIIIISFTFIRAVISSLFIHLCGSFF